MCILITGAAGFIGSNLAAAMIARGERVVGIDNLSLGKIRNIAAIGENRSFSFETVDLADIEAYGQVLRRLHAREPIREVWHLVTCSP